MGAFRSKQDGSPSSDPNSKKCSETSANSTPKAEEKITRVLCLHGWRTSGAILEKQMKKLCESMAADECEFVFPDAPFEAKGPPQEMVKLFFNNMPYYEVRLLSCSLCMCVCMYMYVCGCVCMYTYVCVYIRVYVCMNVYVCVHVCLCSF